MENTSVPNVRESRLKAVRDAFKTGAISKAEFIDSMHDLHKLLFDYSEFLCGTEIQSIEIHDRSIVAVTKPFGVKLCVNPEDKRTAPIEALNFGSYEPVHQNMILALVRETDTVLDIGANIGWYSLHLARCFPKMTIHAFEPIPQTFGFLEKNIALNGFTNISANNLGCHNCEQELKFYFEPDCTGRASSANLAERSDSQLITCRVRPLDAMVRENGWKVDFIKCDCEGAELFVFEGVRETLRTQRPIVFTEMLRKWAAKFGYHPNQIIAMFSELGYECYVVRDRVLERFSTVDENTADTNFFFIHPANSRAPQFGS